MTKYIKWLVVSCCLLVCQFAIAQLDDALVAHYSFDDNTITSTVNDSTINTLLQGRFEPAFDCGVVGDALDLDGSGNRIDFAGALQNEFGTTDISISFYFKPNSGGSGTQLILSKYDVTDCPDGHALAIRYTPFSKTVSALISENANKQVELSAEIDPDACWQHVVVVRETSVFELYLNGELIESGRTSSRANIGSNSPLSIGGAPCDAAIESPYKGLFDEFRIYRKALTREEIKDLYLAPDKIITEDALVVLGDSIQINSTFSCAFDFTWSPEEGISDIKNPNTTIIPVKAGEQIYALAFDDGSCIARDEIKINAVNPDDLDCNLIFLPNIFTPNGDGRNDTYAISNPFAIEEVLSFEIFDRWGSQVFFSTEATASWDGNFKGLPVNASVVLYKVRYTCQGEEFTKTGSVKIFR